jgi:hypothetical protein
MTLGSEGAETSLCFDMNMPFHQKQIWLLVAVSGIACAAEEPTAGRAEEDPGLGPAARDALERCSDFAARLCASATSCCESTTGPFSAERCAASFVGEVCRTYSQVVNETIATYHPESEEPCLAAWARAHETCVVDWQEIIAIRRDVWAACKVMRGSFEVGRGCSTSSECAQPEGAATARCLPDPVSSRELICQVLETLGEGAECRFPDGDVSVCDVGLYCTTTELDMLGTCAPAVPDGDACDPGVPLNPECGLGSYCGLDDGLCHRATNFGGPSCTEAQECVSFQCEDSSTGGTCTEALTTAADLCNRGAE